MRSISVVLSKGKKKCPFPADITWVIDIAIAGKFCLPLNQREEKPDFLVILSNL